MIYPFLCGTLHHQQEDDGIWSSSPVCSPRKSKRKKDTKNPYSTRGLDQFSALLAELEEKRQKIYSQTGSQSMVRFVYKNSNDCVPVVVNLKDKKEEKTKPENTKERSVAILGTCIGWYVVPTINGEGSNLRTSMKKKDYGRRQSGNKLVGGKLSFQKS
ncbi:hypothetical protein E1A91_D13G119500v1 [Gossypium mustelinum]|uniref:Uncharacterized protein n=1 Tax=Gossypium mustelinum TaxID=34275 RepID=A0A5D2S2S6_GOSMU|nr:hypothetical protein E1A91_D13G119500v1 [Gossypium mustelinum]